MDDALVYGSGYETSEAPWNDRLSDIREAECPEERAGQQGWVREERVRTPVWRLAPPPEDSPEEVLESPESPKQKFMRLRDEWKIQRRHESSTVKMVMMPAYQKIIGMGPAAVPFLLRGWKQIWTAGSGRSWPSRMKTPCPKRREVTERQWRKRG